MSFSRPRSRAARPLPGAGPKLPGGVASDPPELHLPGTPGTPGTPGRWAVFFTPNPRRFAAVLLAVAPGRYGFMLPRCPRRWTLRTPALPAAATAQPLPETPGDAFRQARRKLPLYARQLARFTRLNETNPAAAQRFFARLERVPAYPALAAPPLFPDRLFVFFPENAPAPPAPAPTPTPSPPPPTPAPRAYHNPPRKGIPPPVRVLRFHQQPDAFPGHPPVPSWDVHETFLRSPAAHAPSADLRDLPHPAPHTEWRSNERALLSPEGWRAAAGRIRAGAGAGTGARVSFQKTAEPPADADPRRVLEETPGGSLGRMCDGFYRSRDPAAAAYLSALAGFLAEYRPPVNPNPPPGVPPPGPLHVPARPPPRWWVRQSLRESRRPLGLLREGVGPPCGFVPGHPLAAVPACRLFAPRGAAAAWLRSRQTRKRFDPDPWYDPTLLPPDEALVLVYLDPLATALFVRVNRADVYPLPPGDPRLAAHAAGPSAANVCPHFVPAAADATFRRPDRVPPDAYPFTRSFRSRCDRAAQPAEPRAAAGEFVRLAAAVCFLPEEANRLLNTPYDKNPLTEAEI